MFYANVVVALRSCHTRTPAASLRLVAAAEEWAVAVTMNAFALSDPHFEHFDSITSLCNRECSHIYPETAARSARSWFAAAAATALMCTAFTFVLLVRDVLLPMYFSNILLRYHCRREAGALPPAAQHLQ
jgi:hypothetical protein